MKILVNCSLATLFVCLGGGPPTLAQEPTANIMTDAVRVSYDGSPDLPNGIAFVETIRTLGAMRENRSGLAGAFIQQEMGLKTDAATALVDSLLATLEKYDAGVMTSYQNAACEHGAPKAVGGSAFALYEAMEDAGDAYAEQLLSEFRDTLDEDTDARFQQMLDGQKLSISHVKIDYKKAAQLTGKANLDAEISTICSAVQSNNRIEGDSE